MKHIYLAMILMAFLSGCTSGPRIAGLNDPMESKVAISSEGFKKPMMLVGGAADPYFRGWITKADQSQMHQIYIAVNNGAGVAMQDYNELVYMVDSKRVAFKAVRLSFDGVTTGGYGVSWHEDIVVTLSRKHIEWMATQESISFRLNSGKSNMKKDFVIKGAEAASYLASIQEALDSLNAK